MGHVPHQAEPAEQLPSVKASLTWWAERAGSPIAKLDTDTCSNTIIDKHAAIYPSSYFPCQLLTSCCLYSHAGQCTCARMLCAVFY